MILFPTRRKPRWRSGRIGAGSFILNCYNPAHRVCRRRAIAVLWCGRPSERSSAIMIQAAREIVRSMFGTARRSGSVRNAIALVLALGMLTAVTGCKDDEAPAPPAPPAVTVAQPVTEQIADYIDFTGNTAAIDS